LQPEPSRPFHLEDGNGIMELMVMKKHLQSGRMLHQWVLVRQFLASFDRCWMVFD